MRVLFWKRLRTYRTISTYTESPPDTDGAIESEAGVVSLESSIPTAAQDLNAMGKTQSESSYRPFRFTILEALSATGLRSIRYAREIPLLKKVIANDLSATAVKAMKRNVALNFPNGRPMEEWSPEYSGIVGPKTDLAKLDVENATGDDTMELEDQRTTAATATAVPNGTPASASVDESTTAEEAATAEAATHPQCKITINEGDALDVMYSHRHPSSRFHVVDLDPYGSAAPFINGAVQSIADGGLLCVTCTDLAVLASNNYPEKCYALYGGSSTRTEYSHEAALRLVLHSIAMSAAQYGRYIKPLLSLSIDFYLRVFVQVHTAPIEVKKLATQQGLVYTCFYCNNFHQQRLGRTTEAVSKKGGPIVKHQTAVGPPPSIGPGSSCEECGSKYHVAGPMWLDPIHDSAFCTTLLEILERQPERSRTASRIRGMVGTAGSELPDAPFYFTPGKLSGLMHSTSPSLLNVTNALLHAGFRVSRSHCVGGSIKTDASRGQIYSIWRSWIDQGHPVKMESISENSPARFMLLNRRTEQERLAAQHSERGRANQPPLINAEDASDDQDDVGTDAAAAKAASVRYEFDQEHPDAKRLMFSEDFGSRTQSAVKAVRYQQNPLPNWGPGTAASMPNKPAGRP